MLWILPLEMPQSGPSFVTPLSRWRSGAVCWPEKNAAAKVISSSPLLCGISQIPVFSRLLTCCLQPFLKNSLSLCCSKTSWQERAQNFQCLGLCLHRESVVEQLRGREWKKSEVNASWAEDSSNTSFCYKCRGSFGDLEAPDKDQWENVLYFG